MNKFLAVALLLVGLGLLSSGLQRRDSLAAAAATVRSELAAKLDGESRVPTHAIYLVVGTVLLAAGSAGLLVRPLS